MNLMCRHNRESGPVEDKPFIMEALLRLRREAEAVAAAAVSEAVTSSPDITTQGSTKQSKLDEYKDKIIEEIKKCK